MAKYINGVNRDQLVLFPECIDDYITEDNDVRFINAFVNQLNLEELGFCNASLIPSKRGAPSYNPKDLLKIYIYSYSNKIRSSRKIAAEVQRNIELMWLVNRITPDHRTIADFRKNNCLALKNVLKAFNVFCADLNLFSSNLVSLDGSKFKAVNSKENNFTRDKLIDRLKRINNNISTFLDELDCNDASEVENIDISAKKKLDIWNERKTLYTNLLKKLDDNDLTQISLTDPDSKLMKCNNTMLVGYNVQVVTNVDTHLINDIKVTSDPTDNGKILSSSSDTKKLLDADVLEVLADGGYKSSKDLADCLESKIVPVLPDGVYSTTFEFENNEITPEIKKGLSIDDVKKCLRAGIIPDCYSHLNLSLSVKSEFSSETDTISNNSINDDNRTSLAKQGYFIRSFDNKFIFCPQGFSLTYVSSNKFDDTFVGGDFCKSCPKKCTKSECKKLIIAKKKIIQGTPNYGTQTPRNSSSIVQKKFVIATYIPDPKKYKLRKDTSEHPFGTLKRGLDASYFLTKGVDKVTGEMALSALAYNIKRIKKLINLNEAIEYLKNNPVLA